MGGLSRTTGKGTSSAWQSSTTSITTVSGSTTFPVTTRSRSSVSPSQTPKRDEEFSPVSAPSQPATDPTVQEPNFVEISAKVVPFLFVSWAVSPVARGGSAVFIIYPENNDTVIVPAEAFILLIN